MPTLWAHIFNRTMKKNKFKKNKRRFRFSYISHKKKCVCEKRKEKRYSGQRKNLVKRQQKKKSKLP